MKLGFFFHHTYLFIHFYAELFLASLASNIDMDFREDPIQTFIYLYWVFLHSVGDKKLIQRLHVMIIIGITIQTRIYYMTW